MGNKSKFHESLISVMANLAKQGKTDEQIAETIGISRRTYYLWKSKYPELSHAIKESKALPDELVEMALFQKAMGYVDTEEKIFFDSKWGRTFKDKVEKRYAPDVTAMIFWLKNRQPDRWREKNEIGNHNNEPLNITITKEVKGGEDNS